MKSKQEIKDELHKLIDSIEDEDTLNVLNDDIVPYVIENKTMPAEEQELTAAQQRRLEEAIRQAEDGKVIPLNEFYSKMKGWRTK